MRNQADGERPLARETIKLKQLMDRKRLLGPQQIKESDLNGEQILNITRLIGHKELMPGSGQWKVLTTSKPQDECWICGNKSTHSFCTVMSHADRLNAIPTSSKSLS